MGTDWGHWNGEGGTQRGRSVFRGAVPARGSTLGLRPRIRARKCCALSQHHPDAESAHREAHSLTILAGPCIDPLGAMRHRCFPLSWVCDPTWSVCSLLSLSLFFVLTTSV